MNRIIIFLVAIVLFLTSLGLITQVLPYLSIPGQILLSVPTIAILATSFALFIIGVER